MMKKNFISVIIPAYNEDAIIANNIAIVEKTLRDIKKPFEILIVNDGSKDSTLQILKKLTKNKKHLRYISYRDGPSRRENLGKSFKLLNGEFVILLDMDLSLDMKHLQQMIYWLECGYEMVIVNRYHRRSNIIRSPKRYIISKMYNALIVGLFRTNLKDNICGFKAFKHNVVQKLVDEVGIDSTRKRSVFWDTQIIITAIKNSIRIKQLPVHWEEGEKSTLNFQRESGMIPYIFKYWWTNYKHQQSSQP